MSLNRKSVWYSNQITVAEAIAIKSYSDLDFARHRFVSIVQNHLLSRELLINKQNVNVSQMVQDRDEVTDWYLSDF